MKLHSGGVHCFCIILDSHCAHAGFVLDDRQQYALRRRAAQANLADAISGGALSLQAWQEAPCASQAPGMQQDHMSGATLEEPSGRCLTALHCSVSMLYSICMAASMPTACQKIGHVLPKPCCMFIDTDRAVS